MVRVTVYDDYAEPLGSFTFPAMPRRGEVVVIREQRWAVCKITHTITDTGRIDVRIWCARG